MRRAAARADFSYDLVVEPIADTRGGEASSWAIRSRIGASSLGIGGGAFATSTGGERLELFLGMVPGP
jgi:hypothetical protein